MMPTPFSSGFDHNASAISSLQAIQCYVRNFLAKPNPNLGRKGPTCPFVPTSLKFDSIYLGQITKKQAQSVSEIQAIVKSMIPTFLAIEPSSGPKAPFKAIILVFPDVGDYDASEYIDGVQRRLKPYFVNEGLMLGEFHKHNNASGLRNPSFFPLRTPVPCLAIRHMVPSDIVFLNSKEFSPQQRLNMVEKYLEKFADKEDSKDAQAAKDAIEALRKEIHSVAI